MFRRPPVSTLSDQLFPYPTLFRALRERADAVVGAAELEGAGALQGLRLQQHAAADALVEGRRFEKRCPDGEPVEPPGGGANVVEGRRRYRCGRTDLVQPEFQLGTGRWPVLGRFGARGHRRRTAPGWEAS